VDEKRLKAHCLEKETRSSCGALKYVVREIGTEGKKNSLPGAIINGSTAHMFVFPLKSDGRSDGLRKM